MGGYVQKLRTEVRSLALWRDILAEFVGTFFLVSIQCALPLPWHHPDGTLVGIGMGFIVCTMAEAMGPFSGGHFNPAVTLAMALALEVTFLRGLLYMAAQSAAGIAGAGFVYAMTPSTSDKSFGPYRGTLAVTALQEDLKDWQGMLIEAWITAILVLTIFGATNALRKKVFMASIPIGFAIALGIMSAFGSTGGSMNPARSLGPAVIMNSWVNHWVYWVGPFLGAILATIIYKVLLDRVDRPRPEERDEAYVLK